MDSQLYSKVHSLDQRAINTMDRRMLGSGRQQQLEGGFLQYLPLISLASKALGLGKRRKRGGAVQMTGGEMEQLQQLHGSGLLSGLLSMPGALLGSFGLGKSKRARKMKGGIVSPNIMSLGGAVQSSGGAVQNSGGVRRYKKKGATMKAAGFFDVLGDIGRTVGNVVKKGVEIAPEVISTGKQALDLYRTVRGGKKMKKAPKAKASNGRSARAMLVKKVMKEQGLSLPQASKYVKEKKLFS